MFSSSFEQQQQQQLQFDQWITFDRIFGLVLSALSLFFLLWGALDLYVLSLPVPQFMRTLAYFGKIGKEEQDEGPKAMNDKLSSSCELGKRISSVLRKFAVPKSWFGHIYVYFVAVWCLLVYRLLTSSGSGSAHLLSHFSVEHLLLAALLLQSCRRLYETNFVSVYSGSNLRKFCLYRVKIYRASLSSLSCQITASTVFTTWAATSSTLHLHISPTALLRKRRRAIISPLQLTTFQR